MNSTWFPKSFAIFTLPKYPFLKIYEDGFFLPVHEDTY